MNKLTLSLLTVLALSAPVLAANAAPATGNDAVVDAAAVGGTGEKAATAAACEPSRLRPDDYEVAIDRASGITLIQTPCGWTFLGVVRRESIDESVAMARAKPVPASVMAAQIAQRPWLAAFRPQPVAARRGPNL